MQLNQRTLKSDSINHPKRRKKGASSKISPILRLKGLSQPKNAIGAPIRGRIEAKSRASPNAVKEE